MTDNSNLGLQTPQQARSRRTMQHILAATIELLKQKTFDEISIQEIVDLAGCSVGAFYGRFKDKGSLLHALDDQLTQVVIDLIQGLTSEDAAALTNLSDFITAVVRTLYNLHVERRGLMRTLLLAGRIETDSQFREQEERINASLSPVFLKLLSFREQIKHPNPELAIRFGLIQMHFALREMVLWDHPSESIPVSGDNLIHELVRGFLGYLEYQEEIPG